MRYFVFMLLFVVIQLSAVSTSYCKEKNTLPFYIIDAEYQIGNMDNRGHVSITHIHIKGDIVTFETMFSVGNGRRAYTVKPTDIYLSRGDIKIYPIDMKPIKFFKRSSYKDVILKFKVKDFHKYVLNIKGLRFCYKK